MDEMSDFEQQMARGLHHMAGAGRHIDAMSMTRSAGAQSARRRSRSLTSATTLAAAAVIVALVGGFLVLEGPVRDSREPVSGANAALIAAEGSPISDPLAPRRHRIDVDGIALGFELAPGSRPYRGWGGLDTSNGPVALLKDDLYISTDTSGSQAAEAMILWTTYTDSVHARPCLLDPSAGASLADLADAVATAPGTEIVSGPADMTVGGHAAKHVELMVAADAFLERVTGGDRMRTLGCDPGDFFGWEAGDQGAFWQETVPGDTIRVWIVDVDDTLLFIEAETHADVGPAVDQEIAAIIDSIRFE